MFRLPALLIEDDFFPWITRAFPADLTEESGPTIGRRAAFTLRLDTDRHLKLRLAATMQGVSAQSLVTQALDTMFDDIEALDTLVERMKRD